MRWRKGEVSQNVEDRRSERRVGFPRFPRGFPRVGAGGDQPDRVGLPLGRGRIGLGGLLLLLLFLYLVGGKDVFAPGGGLPMGSDVALPKDVGALPGASAEDELVRFISFVLDDVQGTWSGLLPGYREAKLVLYRDSIDSGCGFGEAEMGPFYCPADQKVYVDLSFYDELRSRFGAPGDFAQAYVLAHEIGHHVQGLAGIESEVRRAQRARPELANQLSVRMELQADCLAGVWAHSTGQRGILESGDVEEGLAAAAAVGDDRIQKQARGRVSPESFTHGSSQQRAAWFRRGLQSGSREECDTFAGEP